MPGSRVAVNGVCLAAAEFSPGSFAADLAPETLARTNLGLLGPGSLVNLERPLAFTGRVGGHLMQGHIDGTGELLSLETLGDGNWWLRVPPPGKSGPLCRPQGLHRPRRRAPHRRRPRRPRRLRRHRPSHLPTHRPARGESPGWKVNVEADLIAKYLEKLVAR